MCVRMCMCACMHMCVCVCVCVCVRDLEHFCVLTGEKSSHVRARFGSIHPPKEIKDLEQLLVTFTVPSVLTHCQWVLIWG